MPLKIFKIDLEKVDEAIDKKDCERLGKTKDNEERIAFMTMTNLGHPIADRKRGSQNICNANGKFKLKEYTEEITDYYAETWDKKKNSLRILFIYRSDSEAEEIFALADGVSEGIVTDWADTSFPFSVASAILGEKSVETIAVKDLYNNRCVTTQVCEGVPLNDPSNYSNLYGPNVCTKFNGTTSNVELKRILGKNEEAVLQMEVRPESISFPIGASDMDECLRFCEQLSAIDKDDNLAR